jgi:type VI secretion system VasD/TssJ family lipoprotein
MLFLNKLLKFLTYTTVCLLLISCSNKDVSKIENNNYVPYKKDGINIQYSSVPKLNFYDSSEHRLVFTIYQLKDINNFNILMKEEDLGELILGNKFDNTVLFFDTFSIMPNEKNVIKIDRVEGTKWVAIVAGYFEYNKREHIYKAYKISPAKDKWYIISNNKYNVLDLDILFDKNKLSSKILK